MSATLRAVPPYRVPGERDERPDVEPLHAGPRASCPVCGAKNQARCPEDGALFALPVGGVPGYHATKDCRLSGIKLVAIERVAAPRCCSPDARVRVGWLKRCDMWPLSASLVHLHQSCNACGASWVCAPVVPA